MVHHMGKALRGIDGAIQESDVLDGKTCVQGIGDLQDGMLPHAIGEQISP